MKTQSIQNLTTPESSHHSGTLKRIQNKISANPLQSAAIASVLSAAAVTGFSIVTNTSVTVMANTYACKTETIDNSPSCVKYQLTPTFKNLGVVSNSACPNNPPTNCP